MTELLWVTGSADAATAWIRVRIDAECVRERGTSRWRALRQRVMGR